MLDIAVIARIEVRITAALDFLGTANGNGVLVVFTMVLPLIVAVPLLIIVFPFPFVFPFVFPFELGSMMLELFPPFAPQLPTRVIR